ncbi:DNA-binding CsgD family transcriptional regulator [Allocatelliglobosispora scoriae]|uniref:DNA-binding CsgD family transcriptional regulator n=1 Tax=Allocatelliglobosispora scoriae TaxID=643052 RepID=A0A841C5T0_9ACTN|nr:helix-turn-helix transcriptional regulator [Allocatelliglobosispora scoriae]MBB5874161.1 DNA-binding CsgD family transcriptional regulator [Allocatelliglobosispora scoriae]
MINNRGAEQPVAADPQTAARVIFEEFLAVSRTADAASLLALVTRLEELRADPPDPVVELLAHTLAGVVGVRARLPDGSQRLEAALRVFADHDLTGDPLFLECALLATLTLIRPHQTRPLIAPLVDRLPLDPAQRARLVAMIGLGDAWAGNLVRGQAEMLEARELAIVAERSDVQAEVTSWLVKCEALRGDLAASAVHLAEARELAARTGSAWVAGHVTESAAALHFANGDTEAWLGLLELMVASGLGVDSGLLFEYRWELATHHALCGDHAAASALLDGCPDPPFVWPGGPAMPAWRAWILNPDDPQAMAAFEAVLPALSQPAERLPRARMAWLLGGHHGRAGRRVEAVRLLEAACAGYATIGAAGMLARVAADLREVTERFSSPMPRTAPLLLAPTVGEQPLTGSEVRVAVAIADGLSNREAAERLFVSVKTVEFHLGNIFRKLGVRNRTELARRLGYLG